MLDEAKAGRFTRTEVSRGLSPTQQTDSLRLWELSFKHPSNSSP